MKVLVVGAGASYAESLALQAPADLRMPLMRNFARLLWKDFHPGQSVVDFLMENGIACTAYDALDKFFHCEEAADTRINIETYFEFFWNRRDAYKTQYGLSWWNVLYHGVMRPILDRMLFVFHKNGGGWKPFPLSDKVALSLKPGDLVLNLNYDTIFDIAVERACEKVSYLPNKIADDDIAIAKPHGSLNLLVEQERFTFGRAMNTGALAPKGSGFHFGLLPPRLNKQYSQHGVAARIIQSIPAASPKSLVFWGIGFAPSDVDLVELFKRWAAAAKTIEAINPSASDVDRMSESLAHSVTRFESVDHWLACRAL